MRMARHSRVLGSVRKIIRGQSIKLNQQDPDTATKIATGSPLFPDGRWLYEPFLREPGTLPKRLGEDLRERDWVWCAALAC